MARDGFASKAMGKKGKECRCVEHKNDTDVGATCVKGLISGSPRRDMKNSAKDHNIGNHDEYCIQPCGEEGHSQAIYDVDSDIVTCQSGNAHMLTV